VLKAASSLAAMVQMARSEIPLLNRLGIRVTHQRTNGGVSSLNALSLQLSSDFQACRKAPGKQDLLFKEWAVERSVEEVRHLIAVGRSYRSMANI
jgi:hypothetical protein